MMNPAMNTYPQSTPHEIQLVFDAQVRHQFAVRRTTAKERIRKLKRFHDTIARFQPEIEAAVWKDLRKSPTESRISESGVVLGETRFAMRRLKRWMRPRGVNSTIPVWGSSSEIIYEPKGVCLVLAPWNFPFNLSLSPVVSAIAAGNCVILKPSEHAPHSAALMKQIVAECFSPEEVCVFEGDVSVATFLLGLPFNHIFYTGNPGVGKIVMAAAAEHLASVTLELGGKNPVIVDQFANLDNAAAKIAYVNALNAGQLCIKPDYVLVHAAVKDELIKRISQHYERFYGADTAAREQSPDMCRMVHDRQFNRVKSLLEEAVTLGAKVEFGGYTNASEKYIEPTLLSDVPEEAKIWQEEIFGPIIPFRTWTHWEEAVAYINAEPRPLSMYIFSKSNRFVDTMLRETRAGGVTVNDCGVYFYNSELPFGGNNSSGIGRSHGHFGFLEFTNQKAVLRQSKLFPTSNLILPPYGGKLADLLLKGILKWF